MINNGTDDLSRFAKVDRGIPNSLFSSLNFLPLVVFTGVGSGVGGYDGMIFGVSASCFVGVTPSLAG